METISIPVKQILPCIRPKLEESAKISSEIDEFLKNGGEIIKDTKPTAFKSEFGKKPETRPMDSAVWGQKDEALALLKKHRILNNKLAGKLKIPNSQLESYLKGLRYPSPDTQSRIMTALDALIVAKGVKSESKPR